MMEPYNLPQALVGPSASGEALQEVYILNYASTVTSRKSQITLHYHLFSFLTEGEKQVVYPASTAAIDSSQFLLLSTGNCLMSEKRVGPSGAYRSTMLFFFDQALATFFRKYPDLSAPGPLPPKTPFLVLQTDGFLTNFVQSLNLLLTAGPAFTGEMQALKLEELLLYLCRHYPHQVPALRATAATLEPVESLELRQVVEANRHNSVTVDDLAFLCHTSVSTFKRRFGRVYGTTPSKWLVQQRLALAAGLLQQGSLKTSDVYYRVGYESLSSFIQSFKQAYGVTPKQFQGQKMNV
jgi:AraC-like DNA-binding protein